MAHIDPVDIFSSHKSKLKWLVFIYAVLLYSNTINHQWVLDDYSVIATHEHVQNGIEGIDDILTTNYRNGNSGFNDGLYRPLSLITFAVEKAFLNSNTSIAHIINVLLYAFGCSLLYLSLTTIFSDKPIIIPLGIILLFVAHPIHTEVVANIKSRDELLAFLGFGIALYFMLKLLVNKHFKYAPMVIFGFIMALFSKESAVAYALIIPLLIYLKEGVSNKQTVQQLLILLPLAIVFLVLRNHIIQGMENAIDPGNFGLLNNPIAAEPNQSIKWGSSFALQLLFLFKLIFPFQLIHDYSYAQIPLVTLSSWKSISGILILLLLTLLSIWGILKKKRWGIIAAIYAVSIAISSQLLLPIGIQFAERMLFMSVLPFSFLVVMGIRFLLVKNPIVTIKQQKIILRILVVLLIVFSLKTINRNNDWENNLSLYAADIDKGEQSARINYNYGTELNNLAKQTVNQQLKQSYAEQSINYLNKAISIYPEYLDAYNNLGLAYKNKGDLKQAIVVFKNGIEKDPSYSKNYYNLGTVYYLNKQYRNAIRAFQAYVDVNPSATAYYLMGESAGNLNEMKEAIIYLNKSLAIDPNQAGAYHFLGVANAMLGNVKDATPNFNKAIQLEPRNTTFLMNLAINYRNLGLVNEERILLQRILSISPTHQQAIARLNEL